MIYGIIVTIIDGKQVAAVSSFKFESLDDFNTYNETTFKREVEFMGVNASLLVCTSEENLANFCKAANVDYNLDCVYTYKP